jgi:hypothetical protein
MSDVLANRKMLGLSAKEINRLSNSALHVASTMNSLLLLCVSCFVGVDVVLIPGLPGFSIASANGFGSFGKLFSLLVHAKGRSALGTTGEVRSFAGVGDSVPVVPKKLFTFESLDVAVDLVASKLSFCEKFVSIEDLSPDLGLGGGDCDLCDGESGAVNESSSAFDIMPCA